MAQGSSTFASTFTSTSASTSSAVDRNLWLATTDYSESELEGNMPAFYHTTGGDQEQQQLLLDADRDDDDDNDLDDYVHDVRTPLDRTIDRIGMGSYQWTLLSLCGFGWLADNMWIQAIAIILPRVQRHYSVPDTYIGTLSSSLFAGMMLGAIGWGTCSDLMGRSTAFNATLFFTAVFGMLASFANSFTSLCVILFFLGSSVGGSMPTDGTLLLEHMPKGKQYMVTALSVFFSFGAVLAAVVALLVVPAHSCPALAIDPACDVDTQNRGWKYLLGALGFFTLSMFLARMVFFRLHESPRFLVHAGRLQEALESLQMISRFNGSELTLRLDDVRDHRLPKDDDVVTAAAAASAVDSDSAAAAVVVGTPGDGRARKEWDGVASDSSDSSMASANGNNGGRQILRHYDSTGASTTPLDEHVFDTPKLGGPTEAAVPSLPRIGKKKKKAKSSTDYAILDTDTEEEEEDDRSRNTNANEEEAQIDGDSHSHNSNSNSNSKKRLPTSSSSSSSYYPQNRRRQQQRSTSPVSRDPAASRRASMSSAYSLSPRHRSLAGRWVVRPLRAWWERVQMVLSREWLRTTVLVWLVWWGMSLAYTMFNVFLPKLLETRPLSTTNTNMTTTTTTNVTVGRAVATKGLEDSLWEVVIFTIGGCPGAILGAYAIESPRLGRRLALALSTFATALFCLAFVSASTAWAVQLSTVGISLSATTMWAVLYGWTPEIFGTKVRGTACGIASALSRVGGMIAPILGGVLLMMDRAFPVYMSIVAFVGAGLAVLMLKEDEGEGGRGGGSVRVSASVRGGEEDGDKDVDVDVPPMRRGGAVGLEEGLR